jgi:glycosyltransferase involved in cell wall biosynthesis
MPDVILPVLNEALALPWVLARIPDDYRPIVVDNGSTDGSAHIARALGANVVVEAQRGFGAACWAGLTAATADVVCFMDCDGSLHPADLPKVAEYVVDGTADLVLGRRVPRPKAWPAHARVANRMLALGLRRRTGVKLNDLGPMRAARLQALVDLGIEDRRFGWPLEMVLRAANAGWVINEVDVVYRARLGTSKVSGSFMGTMRAAHDMARVLG